MLQNMYPEIDTQNIEWLLLDLTDLKSINAAANELKRKERAVNILSMSPRPSPWCCSFADIYVQVNNAAVSTSPTDLVASGWEQHMAAKYV